MNLQYQKFVLKERKMDIDRFLLHSHKASDTRVNSAHYQTATPVQQTLTHLNQERSNIDSQSLAHMRISSTNANSKEGIQWSEAIDRHAGGAFYDSTGRGGSKGASLPGLSQTQINA